MPIRPPIIPKWNPVDLAARLVRMGAINPMPLEAVTHEQVELLTATLPSIYVCRFDIRNPHGSGNIEISKYDMSVSGLNNQVLDTLSKARFDKIPERKSTTEYSPESWLGFLNRNVESVDLDEVERSFKLWGITLARERIQDAFCRDPSENLQAANRLLHEMQIDLTARLIRMGVVPPFDFEHASGRKLNEIIQKLPALMESQIVIPNETGELLRLKFVNIAEFHLKMVTTQNFYTEGYHVDYSEPSPDPRTRNSEELEDDSWEMELSESKSKYLKERTESQWLRPKRQVVGGAGQRTLSMQKSEYFRRHNLDEESIIHQRQEITGAYAWSDYFKQDLRDVDPAGRSENGHYQFKALKEAFRNWNLDYKAMSLESGFDKDVEKNLVEARFLFHKALINKAYAAGIIPGMPLMEWKRITPEKAAEKVQAIPLLAEQTYPGEWLDMFRRPIPDDPMELVQIQSSFIEAGIEYNEQAVLASFQQPPPKQEVGKMIELELKDYRMMVGRLCNIGKLELSREERSQLTLEDLRDYVRMADEKASDKQKGVLGAMRDEERIGISEKELGEYSKMEASFLIDKVPPMTIPKEKPEHPVPEPMMKEMQRLQDNGIMPRIPRTLMRYMSEEEGQKKIDSALARQPASDRQKEFIRDSLENGSLTVEDLSHHAGGADVEKLNMLQARNIIGDMPASEKQIETVRQLAEDGRISMPDNIDVLKNRDARKILDEAFSNQGPPDPEGPSTSKQRETIQKLVDDKQIEYRSPEEIKALNFKDSSEVISNAPATPGQKQMYARLVHDGKLDPLPGPTFEALTRGEASNHIDVATGKLSKDKMIQVKIIDYPASDAQLKVLEDLKKKGKVQEIPPEITSKAAAKMISDASAGDPVTPQQLAFLEKKIANNQIPPLSDDEKKSLTQGRFNELIKLKHEPEKEKAKAPEAPAPEKEKTKKGKPVGMNI